MSLGANFTTVNHLLSNSLVLEAFQELFPGIGSDARVPCRTLRVEGNAVCGDRASNLATGQSTSRFTYYGGGPRSQHQLLQRQSWCGPATRSKTRGRRLIFSTCTIQIGLVLTEPEALADFLRRGAASSASGSMDCIGKFKFHRTGRIFLSPILLGPNAFQLQNETRKDRFSGD